MKNCPCSNLKSYADTSKSGASSSWPSTHCSKNVAASSCFSCLIVLMNFSTCSLYTLAIGFLSAIPDSKETQSARNLPQEYRSQFQRINVWQLNCMCGINIAGLQVRSRANALWQLPTDSTQADVDIDHWPSTSWSWKEKLKHLALQLVSFVRYFNFLIIQLRRRKSTTKK